jgi:hypothetical protein
VKLLGPPASDQLGAPFELLASRLASHFGILVPEAAAVEVSHEFAKLLLASEPALEPALRSHPFLNFGSRFLNPLTTWLVDRPIPEAMFSDAVKIFVFDALIQNPDRRVDKPNLGTRGDDIYIFDHESAFSFLYALGDHSHPWKLETQPHLRNHVFYRRLRSKPIDLSEFGNSLGGLMNEKLEFIWKDIPTEWAHPHLARIRNHLISVRDHATEFLEEIRRGLV